VAEFVPPNQATEIGRKMVGRKIEDQKERQNYFGKKMSGKKMIFVDP